VAGPGVTTAAAGAPATVTTPVVRALLDEAGRKGYHHGVLGIRARPEWPGAPTFGHQGTDVTVATCESALAVREALLQRRPDSWLVILTDRGEDDLGAGVLAHLVWHRLRTPDPWDAVRTRFAATGIDPALVSGSHHRDVAIGLLAAMPPAGWPPAPGGVLTRDHALSAVARAHLGLDATAAGPGGVFAWTAESDVSNRVADLRALAADPLADAVLEWAADRTGVAAASVLVLLRTGQSRDVVPVGLVVGVLAAGRDGAGSRGQLARDGLVRLEPRTNGVLGESALTAWSLEAEQILHGLLAGSDTERAVAERVLARADELLTSVHAAALADVSDLLPLGLTRRLGTLAGALRAVPTQSPAAVEEAWDRVSAHELAGTDARTVPFDAAVRLTRWLALDTSTPATSLPALVRRHSDADAWVDSAVNDAAAGVGDPDLGAALGAVLAAVRPRRDAHDQEFATALAAHTGQEAVPPAESGIWHLEHLLHEVVLPLARTTPVLLLVLDGMSVAVGTEVVAGIVGRRADGWAEALLSGLSHRAAGLAVLPTLTGVSRTSLLCGELRTGQQDAERRGYAELTAAYGIGAELFHKKPLDSSRPGYAVADDVGAAVDDVTGRRLVTCVLNTIDDALDRSDPGGIDWAGDAVKHLAPLLERARHAGRVVVLTSDHGHVIERRQGHQRSRPGISSGRSRPAEPPAGDGEVLVEGRRVLQHGGRAVLAVDERLRYGPLKAGYHGGATPAEAVVPVVVLVAGGVIPEGTSLHPAPPQQPTWWEVPSDRTTPPAAPPLVPARRPNPTPGSPTLFDQEEDAPATPAAPAAPALVAAVLDSTTYAAQRSIAGRVSVTDAQVEALLAALLAATGHRLPPTAAATALAAPAHGLRGAILHVQRLLNVESYPVLRIDSDGATVILDVPMLREQFDLAT